MLAESFSKKESCIERSIRSAIETGWDRGNYEYSNELFSNCVDYYKTKPTNGEFIAIIVYNRRQQYTSKGWKTHYYNLLPEIKQRFYKENWEEPSILISGESEGATYGSRRGVTIATIEGSLGLDFRAVILAGLRPLGSHEKAQVIDDFKNTSEEKLLEKQESFKKNINFLYTGCTRAKDELAIILSAPKGESMYMDLLRKSIGE